LSTYVAARWYMKFRSGPYVRRPPLSAQLAKPEIVGKRFFTVNSTTRLRSAEETAGPNPVDEAIGSLFSCRSKCVREILRSPKHQWDNLYSKSPSSRLRLFYKDISRWTRRPQDGNTVKSHNDLLEQLQLLSAQLFGEACQTCDVSIGSGDTRNKSGSNGIGTRSHHNGNTAGGFLGSQGRIRPICYNDVNFQTD